jgi:hypothetical protein
MSKPRAIAAQRARTRGATTPAVSRPPRRGHRATGTAGWRPVAGRRWRPGGPARSGSAATPKGTGCRPAGPAGARPDGYSAQKARVPAAETQRL